MLLEDKITKQMNSLIGISAIVVKELKQLHRNRILVALIIFYPFFAALIIPRVYCFDPKNVNVAIVDYDRSVLSAMLTENLQFSDKITLSGIYGTYDEAFDILEKGDVDCIALIPEGLESSCLSGTAEKIQLSIKAVDITKGILGGKLIKASLLSTASKYFEKQGMTIRPDGNYISEINLYNLTMDYLLYMIPVILLSVAFAICSNVTVNSMTNETTSGIAEIMNVCPLKPWALVVSRIISCYLAGLAAMIISLTISYVAYGSPQFAFLGPIFIFFSLYLLGLSAFAQFIGNISPSPMAAFMIIVVIMTLSQNMSGFLTPSESMVEWMQKLNIINPAHYLVVALRSIYMKGATLSNLLRPLVIMTIQCGVLWTLAICTFKKRQA